jgi:hypothetical protein
MPSYSNIREEELKNKVASDYFPEFDATKIIGNIDFCVTLKETPNIKDFNPLKGVTAKTSSQNILPSKGDVQRIEGFIPLLRGFLKVNLYSGQKPKKVKVIFTNL